LGTSDEYLHKIFGVNVISNFTTVKAFLPDMITKNKGHIVTVASLASYIAVAGMADYGSTKAAVLNFHECTAFPQLLHGAMLTSTGLNQELKHYYKVSGVLTTSVHPNWVRTPLIQSYQAALRATGSSLIEPGDIADAVVKQILSCSSGQLYFPRSQVWVSMLRGFPNWMQEYLRSVTSKKILSSVEK
jgi:all-trans-retinol dehydrogenase (NAD+)